MNSRLFRFFSFALLFVLVNGMAAAFSAPRQSPAQTPVMSEAFKNLLGTDDGAALAILYGSDTRGNIDTCG